jgi:dynein heavy chain
MVARDFSTSYSESTNTVLFQECVRYNRLLKEMAVSLVSCQKALKGEVVMSEELESMSSSIFDNLVPKKWQEVGFLSQKPLASWIMDLNDRVNFLTDWITNGTPKVFWISGFFFPQAFLTGTLQNYSRKMNIAIDLVQFNFDFVDTKTFKEIKEKPKDGCYVYGMYLEGCKWDYKTH